MIFLRFYSTRLARKALILVASIAFFFLVFSPHPARAQWAVYDAANHIQNTITAKAVVAQTAKDAGIFGAFSLDGVAFSVMNLLVEQMLESTISWVNSGFEGSPAFVEDFEGFLIDTADRYALAYIWDGNLQALCSPFKLNIQLALSAEYGAGRDGYQAACRLTDAIKNHENFLNGDFIGGGGWNAWRDITLNPDLNAHGAYLNARGSMVAGISNARFQQQFEINLGDGFLSKRECVDADGDGEEDDNCKIVTPGQTIQGYLGATIAAPIARMTVADEIDELLGALMNQLAGNILGSIRGGGGGSSTGSYGRAIADLEARRQEAIVAAEQNLQTNTPVRDQYVSLIQSGMQLLLSCGGQLGRNQQRDLDVRYEMLKDELADVASGKKNVTEAMVEDFQNTDLEQINRLVESMPDAAACAV